MLRQFNLAGDKMKIEDLIKIKTGPEHEQEFRAKYSLREDLVGNPFWESAYEYAATHKLRPREVRIFESVLLFKDMPPKPAKGVRGCLLWSPYGRNHYFRIYHKDEKGEHCKDEKGHPRFTDYELFAEDIDIEIVDEAIVLRETPKGNSVDWSDKVLGR